MEDLYKYEKELYEKGYNNIAGVDEVGRGPLVGPVVAACCILPKDFILEGLNDSKKLTEKKRDKYYEYIMENALAIGIGIVDEKEIDEINIYQASKKAMIKAIENINIEIGYILIDAMPLPYDNSLPIIKGDAKSISIAAASVIAKVTRDKMMYELDKLYPEYNYKKHKGYPTKEHILKLREFGVKDFYRKTYSPVREIMENDK